MINIKLAKIIPWKTNIGLKDLISDEYDKNQLLEGLKQYLE